MYNYMYIQAVHWVTAGHTGTLLHLENMLVLTSSFTASTSSLSTLCLWSGYEVCTVIKCGADVCYTYMCIQVRTCMLYLSLSLSFSLSLSLSLPLLLLLLFLLLFNPPSCPLNQLSLTLTHSRVQLQWCASREHTLSSSQLPPSETEHQ